MEEIKVESLGEKIRRLRLEKGMSQSDVADGFVTISMISQLERDKNTASVELLTHIAKKLQVPLHVLVQDEIDQMEVVNRHKLAKVYLEIGESIEAEKLLIVLHQEPGISQVDSIDITIDLAESLHQQTKYDDTMELLLPLITHLESVNYDNVHTLALIRKRIGNVHLQKQELTPAYYNYQKAFDLTFQFAIFDQLAAQISFNLGKVLRMKGLHQQSLFYFEKAGDYYLRSQDIRHLADTMFVQAKAYNTAHQHKRASELFSDAYHLYKFLNLSSLSMQVQHNIAVLVTLKEDTEKALAHLCECANFYFTEGDYRNYVLAISKIAEIEFTNDLEKAKDLLDQATEQINQNSLQRTVEEASLLRTWAKFYSIKGNDAKCIEYALKSAELFGIIGVIIEEIESLDIVGDVYHRLGNFEAAYKVERRRNLLYKDLHDRGR
ncbi:helix-turn-helix protein [Tumebacillus sp. BK434]|uniref:helix-turn-helix domain-containing protein n=1 Tax=Tumebacillus sp. BK434 TaxID=2512169 RepID=UPI0010461EBF|nr:helix-turn-helix transcriptional regulator [Tumebacillus sp. BK434]TCP54631.1 helix-turn-helix protein [Tumebacillus sp. BK434]